MTIQDIYPAWRIKQLEDGRVVCWFSCGGDSAVASHLTIEKYRGLKEVLLVYTDPGGEHPDNHRFLHDFEDKFGHKVIILKSKEWAGIDDVFERARYLRGPNGAKCTGVLKKRLRHQFERVESDTQVFGFDARPREIGRADRFRRMNPEVVLETPLIEFNLTHDDCLSILDYWKIKRPVMYDLGFDNANCIGCVKAEGAAYWNLVRKHFPDVFERRARQERMLNYALVRVKKQPIFLDELPEDEQSNDQEGSTDCGILCGYEPEDPTAN
jgi:3'-phosphoadenosine 5'-phosphosulfate sulfotransferase (PAPS reductase)/FAD synthetase